MKTYNYLKACKQQQIYLQIPEVETQKKPIDKWTNLLC